MTYIIKCFSCCYFEINLEINQKPEIMDPERQNLLSITGIREKKRKGWDLKKDLLEQWCHINGEIVLHFYFKCICKVLQN